MKINSVELYNFGSYEGETHFNTQVTNKRNIILVGGKNGAGKTTLFTAMRVCLYGYISMGYKSQNSYYKRAITKLINNNAKMTRPTDAYVQMEIQLSNGRGVDIYRLHRSWVLSDTLTEFYRFVMHPKMKVGAFCPSGFQADFCPGDGGEGRRQELFKIPGAFAVLH